MDRLLVIAATGLLLIMLLSILYGWADLKWGYAGRRERKTAKKVNDFKTFKRLEKEERTYRKSWFWFYVWGAVYVYSFYIRSFFWVAVFAAMYFFAAIEYNLDRPKKKKKQRRQKKR